MSDNYYEPDSEHYDDPESHHQSSRRRHSRQESHQPEYVPQDPHADSARQPRHNPTLLSRSDWQPFTQGEQYHYTHSAGWPDQNYAIYHEGHQANQHQSQLSTGHYPIYARPEPHSRAQQIYGDVEAQHQPSTDYHHAGYPPRPRQTDEIFVDINLEPERTRYMSARDNLDPDYVVQTPNYFGLGKVFSVLWHENQGRNTGTLPSRGPVLPGRFGQPIYSNIRRMVAFKVSGQSSLCFGINTYGGQGVAKRGIDESKHAIVHLSGQPAFSGPREPRMIKEPLELRPNRHDEGLDPMSRLNFSKIYTVEHNIPVRPIGRIASSSMAKFLAYAREELEVPQGSSEWNY
ncbi:hypothetical protein BDV06DRAFT_204454 [Aspergillus oleicola]